MNYIQINVLNRVLRYSFGFEGFLDNIRGLRRHIECGNISSISINKNKPCYFKNQYYPLHLKEDSCIGNNCNLENKNYYYRS